MTTAGPAFAGFFDDAAVFPPGSATLPDAVRAHLARRGTPLGPLVGPLLLTADRVPAAARLARATGAEPDHDLGGEALRVALVVAPDALDAARRIADSPPEGLVVCGLEVRTDGRRREQLRAAVDLAETSPCTVHVELSADAVREGGAAFLGGTRARLKFRTGGLDAALFPTAEQLAVVIVEAVAAQVPYKLTAGLHRAVRHVGPETGFPHHGFLNVALATTAAQRGAPLAEVVRMLSLRDPGEVLYAHREAGAGWRDTFESFGTCSIREPVESLIELGLLDPALLPVPHGGNP